MNLFEFEGKRLLKERGIPVPESVLLRSAGLPAPLPFPFVLKAQVMTGGRGKAGGVRVCADQDSYVRNSAEILDMQIKGYSVCGLLAEQCVTPSNELYISITLQGCDTPTLMFSPAGGVDIEEVVRTSPESLIRIPIDPFTGVKGYQLRQICSAAPDVNPGELSSFVNKLYSAFRDTQALLMEINPLGIVDGRLVAMDAKVILDSHSRAMKTEMQRIEDERESLPNYRPEPTETTTITYVPLDGGDIGLISDGAGTGMLTLDLITGMGGKVASFCELGGTTPAEVMYRAMQYTLERKSGIKAVMVALIGGFNRMDDMANGITGYLRDHPRELPIFVRMCGTMEEEGKAIMARAGLSTYDDLTDTVRMLTEAVKEV